MKLLIIHIRFPTSVAITPGFLKYLIKVIHTAPTLVILLLILTAIGNLISHPIKMYSVSLTYILWDK